MTNVMSDNADAAVKGQGNWILETIRMNGPEPPLGDESTATEEGRPSSRRDSESAGDSNRATTSSATIEHSPATREELVLPLRVAAIRAAIASDTYDVPASAVAAKIVNDMLGGWR